MFWPAPLLATKEIELKDVRRPRRPGLGSLSERPRLGDELLGLVEPSLEQREQTAIHGHHPALGGLAELVCESAHCFEVGAGRLDVGQLDQRLERDFVTLDGAFEISGPEGSLDELLRALQLGEREIGRMVAVDVSEQPVGECRRILESPRHRQRLGAQSPSPRSVSGRISERAAGEAGEQPNA